MSGLLRKTSPLTPIAPALEEPTRFDYGPFRFAIRLTAGASFQILASTDLKNWSIITGGTARSQHFEYVDSDAAKFSFRFYRVLADATPSINVIGYATLTLPPGYSMISNPFNGISNTVGALFKDWPEGTSLSRFESQFVHVTHNVVNDGQWNYPLKTFRPGEGAIFFNPTQDYRPLNFVGEVMQGSLFIPIPAGFSVCSSMVPQPGHLVEELGFPIADGDVIHLFDRDRQRYFLHTYEFGTWKSCPPTLGVGESFWVAKTLPANWTRNFVVA